VNQTHAVPAPEWTEARILPVVAPAGVTRLPLFIVFGYLVSTFVLFLIWPINWPIYYVSDWLRLIGYVGLCFAVISAAMFWGSSGATRLAAPLSHLTLLLVAGAAAAVLLLVPSRIAMVRSRERPNDKLRR
jgi:hypothetical protein